MKTIHQILICIIGTIIFFSLYMQGSGENPLKPEQSKAYNIQGVHEEILDSELDKILNEDSNEKELIGYTKYKYRHEYHLNVEGKVDKATFKFPIPQDDIGKQYISKLKISPEPTKLYATDTNLIAEYNLKNLRTGKYVYAVDAVANVKRYDIAEAKKENKNFKKEEDIKRYLIPENNIEINHPYIKELAKNMEGNSVDEIVSNIFKYVRKTINYAHSTTGTSAVKALKSRRGKCGEFSIAMVALCRAKGIPARIVSGNIAREKDQKHTWVEVYFDDYGWVLYDPTIQNAYKTHKKNGMIERIETIYNPHQNYVAAIRNDLVPWYITYAQLNTGYNGSITVSENIRIKEIK